MILAALTNSGEVGRHNNCQNEAAKGESQEESQRENCKTNSQIQIRIECHAVIACDFNRARERLNFRVRFRFSTRLEIKLKLAIWRAARLLTFSTWKIRFCFGLTVLTLCFSLSFAKVSQFSSPTRKLRTSCPGTCWIFCWFRIRFVCYVCHASPLWNGWRWWLIGVFTHGYRGTNTNAGESRETEKLLWASRNSELFRDIQRLRYADRLPGFVYKTPAFLIPSPIGGQCKCHTPKKISKITDAFIINGESGF